MEDFWRPKKFETGPRRIKENTKERDKKRRIKSLPTQIIQRNVEKKKKKKAYRIQTPSAREHLMWKRFMMYTTLGTSDWKMVEADIKKKKNAGGGESTIIQKHHHQKGKRILLCIAGHSDPSQRWVSNRYGNPPYLFQAHPQPLRFDSMAWH